MQTYDPKELLRELPLVKDVKPEHLHTSQSREPLVGTNGDLRRAVPVEGRRERPALFLLPISRLRRLLQLWPEGEPVRATKGSYCPLTRKWGAAGAFQWEHAGERRFLLLEAGTFQCRFEDPRHLAYKPSGADDRPFRRAWISSENYMHPW